MRNVTCLLALAMLAGPSMLRAQKKDDLASIQRDIATLEDDVHQLRKSQDERNAALTALVQQAVDSSGRAAASLASLQKSLTDSVNASLATMAEQQNKAIAPVALMRTKLDEVSQDVSAVQQTVADLSTKFARFEDMLRDIKTAVTTAPVAAPAPVAPPPAAANTNAVPPGVTAVGLQQDAERDFSGGKYALALDEFANYIKYFPDYAFAPVAQYHIGEIYERGEQWDDAAKAFDNVVGKFPKNEKTIDAAYYKAVAIQKGGHRAEAISEYKDFINTYPTHEHARMARQNLATLEGGAAKGARKKQ